jgi:hypothetical protein
MFYRLSRSPAARKLIGVVSLIAVAFGICQLVLSMISIEGSYKLASLKKEKHNILIEVEILKQEVDMLKSIPRIHSEATKLGMVSSDNVSFLYLSED